MLTAFAIQYGFMIAAAAEMSCHVKRQGNIARQQKKTG
jgi:hypothetical protein